MRTFLIFTTFLYYAYGKSNYLIKFLRHHPSDPSTSIPDWTFFQEGDSNQDEWTYDDQANWPGSCNTGFMQSPINIDTDDVVPSNLPPFYFKNFQQPRFITLNNTGKSVEARLLFPSDNVLVYGGPLTRPYKIDNIHYHWESEHTLDGIRFPLESHMVLYANNFNNITEALRVPGGVAVIGTFYDIDHHDDDNEQLRSIFDIPLLRYFERTIALPLAYFLPTDCHQYFTYKGSLTTPQCNEGIRWIIFRETLTISTRQLISFRTLPDNYRELQNLNDRIIYIN